MPIPGIAAFRPYLRSRWFKVSTAFLLGVSGLIVAMYSVYLIEEIRGRKPLAELMDLHAKLALGQTPTQVLEIFDTGAYEQLTITAANKHWVVGTPPRVDAANWLLWIQYHDGRVVALRFTTDDNYARPDSAPPDQAVSGAAEWPVTNEDNENQRRIRGPERNWPWVARKYKDKLQVNDD